MRPRSFGPRPPFDEFHGAYQPRGFVFNSMHLEFKHNSETGNETAAFVIVYAESQHAEEEKENKMRTGMGVAHENI